MNLFLKLAVATQPKSHVEKDRREFSNFGASYFCFFNLAIFLSLAPIPIALLFDLGSVFLPTYIP